MESVRVYLGGKIGHTDWRHDLFDVRGVNPDRFDKTAGVSLRVREEDMPRRDRWIYNGPFFMSCDHGCGHGRSTHGLASNTRVGCIATGDGPVRPSEVVAACKYWIGTSDAMFVWLDSDSAYGTVAEVGFAVAAGVPVFLFEPPTVSVRQSRDMWFVREMATQHDWSGTAVSAWSRFERMFAAYEKRGSTRSGSAAGWPRP